MYVSETNEYTRGCDPENAHNCVVFLDNKASSSKEAIHARQFTQFLSFFQLHFSFSKMEDCC